eukprot:s4180_g9.t1
MVSMYHMGDQPTSFPEEFELSEDSEEIEIEYFGRVLRVIGTEPEEGTTQEPEEFWIGDEDDEYQEDGDELNMWYHHDRGYFYECPNGCHHLSWHPNMQECEYGCHHPPRRNPVDRTSVRAARTEPEVEGTFFARTARRQGPREIEVVLDSGADISLAPMWMKCLILCAAIEDCSERFLKFIKHDAVVQHVPLLIVLDKHCSVG